MKRQRLGICTNVGNCDTADKGEKIPFTGQVGKCPTCGLSLHDVTPPPILKKVGLAILALLAIILGGWYFWPRDCSFEGYIQMASVHSGTYYLEDHPTVATFLASLGKDKIVIDKDFFIQTGEVTVAEFRRFVKSGWLSQADIENLGTAWEDGKDEYGKSYRDNSPVSRVPWDIANEYAQWMSDQTGCRLQLPTQEQWAAAVMSYKDEQTKQMSKLQTIDTQKKTPDHLLFNREEWSRTQCGGDGKRYKTLGYDYFPHYDSKTDYVLRCPLLSGSMSVGFRLVKE
jgi:hypothetical protein